MRPVEGKMIRCAPMAAAIFSIAMNFPLSPARAQDVRDPAVNPDMQLWHALKKQLSSSHGVENFEQNIKDTQLPTLVGRLVSATPPEHPSVLVLAMYDSDQPEVTLRLKDGHGAESHMAGTMALGSAIRFEGVGAT